MTTKILSPSAVSRLGGATSVSNSLSTAQRPSLLPIFQHDSNGSRHQQKRFFLNPFGSTGVQKLQASRVLPYSSDIVFDVITDVASYKHFIPYCQASEVLKYSGPTSDGKRWPEEAKLLIGFNGDVSETFWSRVYCVPNKKIVETVAGSSETTLSSEDIKHHNPRMPTGQDPVRQGNVMKSLSSKWMLRPRQSQETEVSVQIEYEFANPVYGALSSAASPIVADKMIGAFQKRVQAVVQQKEEKS